MVDIQSIRAPLFVPANRPERFAKAASSGADAIILDLEDGVPIDAKEFARASLNTSFTTLPVLVRINAVESAWHAKDLVAIFRLSFTAVILPKAEDAAVCTSVAEIVGKPIVALIESAKGLANARAIASASGICRLAFGSVDYCADVSCSHLQEVLLPARSEIVLASRLGCIGGPLDGVTLQLDNPSACRNDATHAKNLGMSGKLCIHPKQVPEIMSVFTSSELEIGWAERVLASGDGAIAVDGQMVDEPVRIRARAILSKVVEK